MQAVGFATPVPAAMQGLLPPPDAPIRKRRIVGFDGVKRTLSTDPERLNRTRHIQLNGGRAADALIGSVMGAQSQYDSLFPPTVVRKPPEWKPHALLRRNSTLTSDSVDSVGTAPSPAHLSRIAEVVERPLPHLKPLKRIVATFEPPPSPSLQSRQASAAGELFGSDASAIVSYHKEEAKRKGHSTPNSPRLTKSKSGPVSRMPADHERQRDRLARMVDDITGGPRDTPLLEAEGGDDSMAVSRESLVEEARIRQMEKIEREARKTQKEKDELARFAYQYHVFARSCPDLSKDDTYLDHLEDEMNLSPPPTAIGAPMILLPGDDYTNGNGGPSPFNHPRLSPSPSLQARRKSMHVASLSSRSEGPGSLTVDASSAHLRRVSAPGITSPTLLEPSSDRFEAIRMMEEQEIRKRKNGMLRALAHNLRTYRAIAQYDAAGDGELSLKKGDVIMVIRREKSGTWVAETKSGLQGRVHMDYLVAYDPAVDTSDEAKRKEEEQFEKRTNVGREIVETERTYIHGLKTVIDLFQDPLFEAGFMPKSVVQAMFPTHLPMLHTCHMILLERLEERMQNWGKNVCIGDIFTSEYVDFFKVYAQYCNDFTGAIKTINNALDHYEEFKKFLKETAQNPACGNLDLAAFLLTPVQRLPRYVLLLGQMLKYTGLDHPDHYYIGHALEKMRRVTEYVNERKGDMENRVAVTNMAANIKRASPLLRASEKTRLIREMDVGIFIAETNHVKRGHLFLLNDALLVVRYRKRPKEHCPEYGQFKQLEYTRLQDLEFTLESGELHLQIRSKGRGPVLQFNSTAERTKWKGLIDDAKIKLLAEKEKARETRASKHIKAKSLVLPSDKGFV